MFNICIIDDDNIHFEEIKKILNEIMINKNLNAL